jgi:hypothetical protein
VLPDGSYSRWPTGAVGVLLPQPGSTSLDPSASLLIGAPGTAGFGARKVSANGVFMDYDGQPQARPDVTTRGIMLLDPQGCVSARYYVNVFPSLDGSHPLGRLASGNRVLPTRACGVLSAGGVPELQPGAATAAGLPVASALR